MCYQNIENAQVNRFKQKNGKKTCENGELEIVS